ncbi:hypothetical protein, partial [Candidatus Amarolinea dominans]|uniref:hypothetical protein n=1 Tax=Candidatus Amarolinea dominans TaxID=3140696 RepID=UPI0031CCD41C
MSHHRLVRASQLLRFAFERLYRKVIQNNGYFSLGRLRNFEHQRLRTWQKVFGNGFELGYINPTQIKRIIFIAQFPKLVSAGLIV